MGSYKRQTLMVMERGKWRKTVNIDTCLVQEIAELWHKKIETVASCCGHNIDPGKKYKTLATIIVVKKDTVKMEELGYEHADKSMREMFYAKTV